ncbi:PHP domain-containing protein [Reichenbachiella carrageenanivorans]|uniref:PHP domain-containing protein n=1 Tax=Reichenbachiella carrageenanivorans TaxID=2979869 RepID=A0ABY6CYW3_9BACT|nr:PHP domain-containing protein [Reichenbachiella carrageenanivorans]UXX79101.1 PHP domain-containing protein [Reichenbachiella carrageenanivorans]
MTNAEIKNKLKLAAKLMELHGENPFKTRSYQTAADTISGLDVELSTLATDDIPQIEGIGKGMAANIVQLLERGSFESMDQLKADTPEGVIEMFKISGFGPKKIAVLWKEGGAETLEDLLDLCAQGRVAKLKGFAEKTQESLKHAIQFALSCRGFERYANVEPFMIHILAAFENQPTITLFSETAELRRRMETISRLDFLIASDDFEATRQVINLLPDFMENEKLSGPFSWYGIYGKCDIPVKIRFCATDRFYNTLVETTANPKHLHAPLDGGKTLQAVVDEKTFESEATIYKAAGLALMVPELREGSFEIDLAKQNKLPELIEMKDLKGILHNHSTYSDGKHTLRQMAEHCRDLGYEYLGITDHSQTAVYASGLKDFEVKAQQEEIKKLNEELAPFKVFSGIESDILADGSLDYPEEILASFDFIVASVHSGLTMDQTKATNRLLAAIHNPHTTILGHMTGRLILEREGYPVDHKAVIDACAERGVVIEINASPYRLDIDWRWIQYALEKGVTLSINPDAHKMEGYKDMYYGLLAARKGGLTKAHCLNAMSLKEISSYFEGKKK